MSEKIERIQLEIKFRLKRILVILFKYSEYCQDNNLKEFLNQNAANSTLFNKFFKEFISHAKISTIKFYKNIEACDVNWYPTKNIGLLIDTNWSELLHRLKQEDIERKSRQILNNFFKLKNYYYYHQTTTSLIERNRLVILFNKEFENLIRVVFYAASDDYTFKKLVRKRLVFDHKSYYPSGLSFERCYLFKKAKKRLKNFGVQFYSNKVYKKALCSVCYEPHSMLEQKNIDTIVYSLCGHTICRLCDRQITDNQCPVCRTDSTIRMLTTINNNFCAGTCNQSHYYQEKILIAECGHLYCCDCVNDMVIESSSLLSYIHYKKKPDHNSDIKCRICKDSSHDITIKKWLKIFLAF